MPGAIIFHHSSPTPFPGRRMRVDEPTLQRAAVGQGVDRQSSPRQSEALHLCGFVPGASVVALRCPPKAEARVYVRRPFQLLQEPVSRNPRVAPDALHVSAPRFHEVKL